MNKPIRRVAIFCMVLVLALLLRDNWIQMVKAGSYKNNSANRRVQIAEYSHPRGNIYVSGKSVTDNKKSAITDKNYYAYQRTYKHGEMYAPVTGYSSQVFGNSGLEKAENGILSGDDDRLFFRRTIDLLTGKQKKGGSVMTTINAAVQQAAWNGLKGKKGAAAAIDPTTGKILALVSAPSYDPTSIAGHYDSDGASWTKLNKESDAPMLNRALDATYPPGSTFKLVTAAAALNNGFNGGDIDKRTNSPDPYQPDDGKPLRNEGNIPCLNASLNVALQYSCNSVFGKIGADLGATKMAATAKSFGFDTKGQTVPSPVAESVFDGSTTNSQAFTALSSIGQYNTRATPLQMAMVASAVADDGKLMKPYLVDQLVGPDLSVISQTKPKQMSQPMQPDVAQKLQKMMVNVVQHGTGTNAQISGVTVGGKTGTAQHGVGNDKNPYAWFVSYAKVGNNPKIAVAVVVEDDNAADRADISGGGLAAPIAKAMMQAATK